MKTIRKFLLSDKVFVGMAALQVVSCVANLIVYFCG